MLQHMQYVLHAHASLNAVHGFFEFIHGNHTVLVRTVCGIEYGLMYTERERQCVCKRERERERKREREREREKEKEMVW